MITESPRRQYDLSIHVCGDDKATCVEALKAACHWLLAYIEEGIDGYFVNGNSRGGFTIDLRVDKTHTNANYYKQLDEFLKQRNAR